MLNFHPVLLLSLSLALTHCVPIKRKATVAVPAKPAIESKDSQGLEEEGEEEWTDADGDSEVSDDDSGFSDEPTEDGGTKDGSGGVVDKGKTGGTLPLKVPASQKLVFRPLGLTEGGYQSIKEAKWPDKCVKGAVVPTSGALFPFNEKQTLVIRGPMKLSGLIVYRKTGEKWTKLADLASLSWNENTFGSVKNLGPHPMEGKVLENGRELYTHLPESGEKIIVAELTMPAPSGPAFSSGAQNNVPALWVLNSRIFEEPSSQYFCNCRGLGNPGGCGELDIAEIIPENKNEVTSTLYSYEGARGGVLPSPRPLSKAQIYAAVLREEGSAGEAAVLEVEAFDFSLKELPDSFVAKDWLPSAKLVNKGAEALIKP